LAGQHNPQPQLHCSKPSKTTRPFALPKQTAMNTALYWHVTGKENVRFLIKMLTKKSFRIRVILFRFSDKFKICAIMSYNNSPPKIKLLKLKK
jgi:hypothetical protein